MRSDPHIARPSEVVERLWRLRKMHQHVDASLRDSPDGVQLLFFYNARLIYQRTTASRAAAVAEAVARRTELERHGWTEHW